MKLGSQTNSLTNHILSRAVIGQPEPVVGMGATILSWTDRHPATITKVQTDTQGRWIVTVQEDQAERLDDNGFSESQKYKFSLNPNGFTSWFRFETGKGWREITPGKKLNSWKLSEGHGLRIGERNKYHDFSF